MEIWIGDFFYKIFPFFCAIIATLSFIIIPSCIVMYFCVTYLYLYSGFIIKMRLQHCSLI
jgi:chromate transport protein ChrA